MKQNSQISKVIYHTYDEWKRLGYGVIKGSKSIGIDDSFTALFSERQVSMLRTSKSKQYKEYTRENTICNTVDVFTGVDYFDDWYY